MKVALITPSNISHMPYVKNYIDILTKTDTEFEIYNWDRLHIETNNNNTYKDKKISIKKSFLDYYFYSRFLKKKMVENKYDIVIIFGLQLAFFLSTTIKTKYKKKFILDIRDKNPIIHFMNLNKLIKYSACTIISSEKYKDWLPQSNYKINHNTSLGVITTEIPKLKKHELVYNKPLNIMTIGTIRDYEINEKLIKSLSNNENYKIGYIGDGNVAKRLEDFCIQNDTENVYFKGRYKSSDEKTIIDQADIVSVLRYNDSENNRTALPNRLYSALQSGKILLAYKGTYLSDLISKYNLGLVIDNFEDIDNKIDLYIKNFEYDNYKKGRDLFLKRVVNENYEYICTIQEVLKEE
ncbi:TPA: glycosyltransferase [Enterococcus faecium]